jgi:hypothetical protein
MGSVDDNLAGRLHANAEESSNNWQAKIGNIFTHHTRVFDLYLVFLTRQSS